MMSKMYEFLRNSKIVRYFGVAALLVSLELVLFQLFYLIWRDYIWATVLSFTFAVVGNWFLSRTVVFKGSRYRAGKEFLLVALASIVGLAIQLGIVYVAVEQFGLIPVVGKAVSITGAFFWNYWARARYIFKS